MAKKTYTIRIHCNGCRQYLYKYLKEGPGSLVKCFTSNLLVDNTEEECVCPKCKKIFAKKALVKGRSAHKIISGAIYVRGNTGKK